MSDHHGEMPPEEQVEEIDMRLRVAALEHRALLALVLAFLAEAGVIALAVIYMLGRRGEA